MLPHLQQLLLSRKGSLSQKVAAILRKYGTDAHVYLPGIGVINGLTAGNYLDSAGTTAATVDNPVGLVLDGANSQLGSEVATANYFTQATYDNTTTSVSASAFNQTAGTTAPRTLLNFTTVIGKLYKVTFKITLLSAGTVDFNWRGGSNGTGSVLGSLTNLTASSGLVTEYVTADVTASSLQFFGSNAGSYFNVDTISIKEVTGIHATKATTANKPILRLSGGKYSWQFDGSNDSLALGSVPFQMDDDHCVIAGVNLAISATSAIYSQSGAQSPNFELGFGTGAIRVVYKNDAATQVVLTEVPTTIASNVVIAARKVSNTKILRKNATQIATDSAALGVGTSTSALIGARTSATALMNGSIYPVIVIKGTVTDADLLILEKFVGSLSGVPL